MDNECDSQVLLDVANFHHASRPGGTDDQRFAYIQPFIHINLG